MSSDWMQDYISSIGLFAKLMIVAGFHGGDVPPFAMLTEPVQKERNRLITQGNERLKRIQDLEARVKTLTISNEDIAEMVDQLINEVDEKDRQIGAMKDFIEHLISG